MPEVLKPDMKAIVWLALGLFVAPKLLGFVQSRGSSKKSGS